MSSPDSPSEDLTFPSIQVNGSLPSLVLDALAMPTHARRHHEAAASSLDDSTYDLLDESPYETSDDEGRTESLASTEEGHTPDDASSAADTEEFEEGDLDDNSQQLPGPSPQPGAYNPGPHNSINTTRDSLMASRADTHLGESSHIELEEIPSQDPDVFNGYGVVRQFEGSEVPEILRLYNSPEVQITIKMTLSTHFLTVSRPFRILYIGEVPLWAKDDINSHIAAALTVGSDAASMASSRDSQSSRFSVVRIPSFPKDMPTSKVQLVDSSGLELVVDQCTGARRMRRESGKAFDIIEVSLNDGTLLIFGPGNSVQVQGGSGAPHLPDLAVFGHNTVLPITDAATQLQEYNLVREAFKRHSIPSLDIAMVRPFHDPPKSFSFTNATLRSCVEGRSDVGSNFKVLETLPIDIYSFLEVPPSQLNRHLALITKSRDDSYLHLTTAKSKSQAQEFSSTEQPQRRKGLFGNMVSNDYRNSGAEETFSSREWLQRITPSLAFRLALSILTSVVAIYLASSGFIPMQPFASSVAKTDSASAIISITPFTPELSPPPPPTSALTTTPSALTSPQPRSIEVTISSKDLTVATPEKSLGQPFGNFFSGERVEDAKFDIDVVDEHRFTLTVPSILSQRRKPPQLRITVSLNSELVPIRTSKSKDGLITVDLEQEYPLGIFDVEVATLSKPLLSQKFNVALGLRWHKLFALNRNVGRLSQSVKHDIIIAQQSLRNISNHVSKSLQASLSRFEDGTAAALYQTKNWKNQVQKSTRSAAGHLQDAKQEAVRRMCSGSGITKKISDNIRRNKETCTAKISGLIHTIPGVPRPDLWEQTAPLRTSKVLAVARSRALKLWEKVGAMEKEAEKETAKKETVKNCRSRKGRRRSRALKSKE